MKQKTIDWKPTESKNRCVALDMFGKRCLKHAKWSGPYHGENELYRHYDGDEVVWVYIALCDLHASKVP